MDTPDSFIPLSSCLADAVPRNLRLSFRHLATPPTRSSSIFPTPPGKKPQKTFRESHLLTVSLELDPSRLEAPENVISSKKRLTGSEIIASPSSASPQTKVFIFAIEIFVFSTRSLTCIFVSKADSTGFLGLVKDNQQSAVKSDLFRSISTAFIQFLVRERKRKDVPLIISLFARAQGQYLFPGSIEYPAKHMASGPQLVRWWCRVLGPVMDQQASEYDVTDAGTKTNNPRAYLIIPGETSISPYLPRAKMLNTNPRWRWTHGHPFDSFGPYHSGPLRCRIPYFPDDPKSRFIDQLDEDLPEAALTGTAHHSHRASLPPQQREAEPRNVRSGDWTAVRSFDQFWEFIAYRQECASGSLTGFFYLVFPPIESEINSSAPISPSHSQPPQSSNRKKGRPATFNTTLFDKTGRLIPIIPRHLKSSGCTAALPPASSPFFIWPVGSRGTLVLSEIQYNQAMQALLRTDFSSPRIGFRSTQSWITQVSDLTTLSLPLSSQEGGKDWEILVTGKRDLAGLESVNGHLQQQSQIPLQSGPSNDIHPITTLLTGRKKRKPSLPTEPIAALVTSSPAILSGNLLRKKPKV